MYQDYAKYTDDDRFVWLKLFDRQMEVLPKRASEAYFEGIRKISFNRNTIPNFYETNKLLKKETGWQLVVVKGLIDNKPFFELLENAFPPFSIESSLKQQSFMNLRTKHIIIIKLMTNKIERTPLNVL